MLTHIYRVAQKIGTIFCKPQLYQILTDFSKLFYFQNQEKIFNNTISEIPLQLSCVATLPFEMSSVLKAIVENKTTSVTTHFKSASSSSKADTLNI